jgi:integrase
MSRGDQETVRALAPSSRVTLDGVEVERLASGELRYWTDLRIGGRRIHKLIGTQATTSLARARVYVAGLRLAAREDRLQLPKGRKPVHTVASAAEPYLVKLTKLNGRNIQRKRRHLELHLVPALGHIRLSGLDEEAIEGYRTHRHTAGAAHSSINRELASLSDMVSWAVRWKWIGSRPCRIRKVEEHRQHRVALTGAEVERLMAASLADSDLYLHLFTAFCVNSGMRSSEVLAARFEHVDFEGCRLFVPAAKAGARTQPITVALRDLIRREQTMSQDPAGWIFPSARPALAGAGHRTRMDRSFARAVKAAGLAGKVTPHALRHTAITRLVKAGIDLPTIQKISGHRTLQMVLEYTHIDDPHIDRAITHLAQGFEESFPPTSRQRSEDAEAASPKSAQIIDLKGRK